MGIFVQTFAREVHVNVRKTSFVGQIDLGPSTLLHCGCRRLTGAKREKHAKRG